MGDREGITTHRSTIEQLGAKPGSSIKENTNTAFRLRGSGFLPHHHLPHNHPPPSKKQSFLFSPLLCLAKPVNHEHSVVGLQVELDIDWRSRGGRPDFEISGRWILDLSL